ncbi:MAG: bifunctional metallophosphatase/5'-nucleotidase [Bradymonadia bacterium]|jgi:2',3'-cyclic-nucleotide 2'-phosphodiesterase (5'-nucleotidase family)
MRFLWIKILACTSLCLTLFACNKKVAETETKPEPELVGASDETSQAEEEVKIIFWNDFHATLFEIPDKEDTTMAIGGLPWFMAAVEAEKEGYLPLILDGGDQFQGSSLIGDSKGMGMVDIMNSLGIDATVIGNHDFDYGASPQNPDPTRGALYAAMKASNYAWLAANISHDKNLAKEGALPWPPPELKPYTIIEKGPYRIAVIGLSTTDTPVTTLREHVIDLVFEPADQALSRIMPSVVAENPDYIIVLGHLTGTPQNEYEKLGCPKFDGELASILALPQETKKHINAIFLGHSHRSFAAVCDGILIAENTASGRSYTTVTLKPENKKLSTQVDSLSQKFLTHKAVGSGCSDEPFPLEAIDVGGMKLKPSQSALSIIEKLDANAKTARCEVIGCAKAPIIRNKTTECPIGNLVAEAMMKVYPKADLAIQNSGGLRSDILKNTLHREDVEAIMPFENYIYLIEMPGADLLSILKVATSGKHGLFQVAGLRYIFEIDCNNPEDINKDGKLEDWEHNCLKERSLFVAKKRLNPKKKYKVAINNFLFDGGDSLSGLFDRSKIIDKGPLIKTALIDYIQKSKTCIDADTLLDDRVMIAH